jgi:type VI secretion system (T6SS) baseplate-like injector VgrG
MSEPNRYYGIYRGSVVNNIDPMQMGRIMVTVPDVGGAIPSTWAMPCVPFAGKKMGAFMVPQVGAGIWVQFEGGDPDYPVWISCWWGQSADLPSLALAGVPADPNLVLQSMLQNVIVISDLLGPTGGITLQSTTGASIIVNDTGVYIKNGKGASIQMVGTTVTINSGALVVT